jgi:hypothetical protein
MKKMILILMLFSLSAIADETVIISNEAPIVTMADLKAGDELLVTNDNEIFTSVTFKEMCFVLTPDGFESRAMLSGMAEAGTVTDFSSTYLPDKTPVESVKMMTGSLCSSDGKRTYLVPKTQLIGLLTRLDNMMNSGGDTAKALRAFSELYNDSEEARKEIAEIRRIIVD